jgi:hypothetical protein
LFQFLPLLLEDFGVLLGQLIGAGQIRVVTE